MAIGMGMRMRDKGEAEGSSEKHSGSPGRRIDLNKDWEGFRETFPSIKPRNRTEVRLRHRGKMAGSGSS